MERHKTVDDYIEAKSQWSEELSVLRDIFLETELEETVKWGAPAYTLNSKNVAGLAAFKEHFAIWFHNGVFLKDSKKKLVNAQEGTTRALRQWRFESMKEIDPKLIKEYILEAIQNEKEGKKMKPAKPKKAVIPDELKAALEDDAKLKDMFDSLTPFKQKEYAEHIGNAKQEKTRISRLEKSIPLILEGKGLNDKYR